MIILTTEKAVIEHGRMSHRIMAVLLLHAQPQLYQQKTLRICRLGHITISKQLPSVPVDLSRPKMQMLLILSALLVGKCLTVARVEIIMISLDHGDICSIVIAVALFTQTEELLTQYRSLLRDIIVWGTEFYFQ